MISIGPYTFTETDAKRTVLNAEVVLALYAEGRDAGVLDPLRPTLTGDLHGDLERVWASWMAAGPALRAAGQMPGSVTGSVAQLNISSGGVPKRPFDRVEVGWRGVENDRQATRFHHGRPWQALCLWSTEVIDELRAQGHPIEPGFAGENITLSGLPWGDVRAGVRLRIGDVLCEVSAYALPCATNKAFFIDGAFEAMHHSRGPVSRMYATVLEPGAIAVGDRATLEP